MRVRSVFAAFLAGVVAPALGDAQSRNVPTPASVTGHEPSADHNLLERQQVVAYFKGLDAASPRVQLRVLGKTTLGRFLVGAFISDADNFADLPKISESQRKLSDLRLTTAQQRMVLERNAKVVARDFDHHSPEVGGILAPLTLTVRLATSEDAEAGRSARIPS